MRTLAAFVILFASGHAYAADRSERLLLANCKRVGGEYVGTLRGKVLLHREFLAALGKPDDAIRTSIEHQLRYLWGHYRNDAVAHQALQVALSAEKPEIRVLAQHEVPYGRALGLPYDTNEARLALDDEYTKAAVKRGHTLAADPALLIEYEIRFKLAICGRGEDPSTTLHVPLPQDPWLAYWYVPLAKHRPLRYMQDRAVTNPCADNDFADLPHPFYYWYDWLPTRHGPDDDGHHFDCRKWLTRGDQYADFDVAIAPASSINHDFSRLRAQLTGPLRASILVGAIDHTVTHVEVASYQALLGESKSGELGQRAKTALEHWKVTPPSEHGTHSFLSVLAALDEVMIVSAHDSGIKDGYLRVTLDGTLKKSARQMHLSIWLGLTDIFGPTPPNHWPILREALAKDQIVVYWGHSGIGENFRLAQIEKHVGATHAQMSAELARSPLRLTAFISCYSYMYFGQDLLAAGAERADGGYFIFTGTEGAKHEAGPLAVLDLVDDVLRPDNATGRVDTMPRLGEDEFWMVKEVAGH